LDKKLTKSRLLQEARMMQKARMVAQVTTPRILFVDLEAMALTMEFIEGVTVRDWISHRDDTPDLIELGMLCGPVHFVQPGTVWRFSMLRKISNQLEYIGWMLHRFVQT
jgi:tRNA A-37 threonylcarbamoyl transferase component Bud32